MVALRPSPTVFAVALLTVLFGGCLDDQTDTAGNYASFDWGRSQKNCVNGVCSYGTNSFTDSAEVECGRDPTLSWDANNWIHGSVRLQVLAPNGTMAAEHTVAGNGKGSMPVEGPAGTWTLKGTTRNANGSMQGMLVCS